MHMNDINTRGKYCTKILSNDKTSYNLKHSHYQKPSFVRIASLLHLKQFSKENRRSGEFIYGIQDMKYIVES